MINFHKLLEVMVQHIDILSGQGLFINSTLLEDNLK